MEKSFWDQRYGEPFKSYGKAPNQFFKSVIDNLKPGKILLPGEGEGRNAVYAASQGWETVAFDSSMVAREHALSLARDLTLTVSYRLEDYSNFTVENESYDLVVLVYTHMPPKLHPQFFEKIKKCLKKGGKLVMEVFSKDQLQYNSGGPPNPELLYSTNILQNYLSGLNVIKLTKEVVNLQEGKFHNGPASVIRVIAQK